MHRRLTIITATIMLAIAGHATADDKPKKRIDPTSTPQLSQAFAIAHVVTVADRRADTYPYDLTVTCDRKDRRRFWCRTTWYEPNAEHGRIKITGIIKVWLMRHQDGTTFWHFIARLNGFDKHGDWVKTYNW